ncbi:hypothetical protein CDO73_00905 [Saccharibacillus sp. O23]|nr:hypothetical protein CDO73_00905 [Saccharibacillus sp. O23]
MLAAAVLATGTVWGAAGGAPQVHAAAAADFTDVKSTHWAKSSIEAGVAKGYVDGYTNGTFKPDASVSRAEFVKMVVAAMKLEVKETSGKWYVPYVDAASAKGWYAAGDFANNEAAWNKTMTREEMARVAARAIGETSKEDDKWMYLATKAGLIQGVGKGQLAPQGLTTRAQSVVIIERILTANAGGKLDSDRYATGAAEILWHGTNIFTVMPEKFVTPESDWKSKGKSSVEEMWNEKNMTITSKDGLYQGKLEALIAIDLDDKNDPNRSLLPLDKLKWFNGYENMNKNLLISKEKGNYLLYFKGKQVFNKDTKKYINRGYVPFRVRGFDSPNEDLMYSKNKLNGIAPVYVNDDIDTPAVIIPKTGTVQQDRIAIQLVTPGGGQLKTDIDVLSLRGVQ